MESQTGALLSDFDGWNMYIFRFWRCSARCCGRLQRTPFRWMIVRPISMRVSRDLHDVSEQGFGHPWTARTGVHVRLYFQWDSIASRASNTGKWVEIQFWEKKSLRKTVYLYLYLNFFILLSSVRMWVWIAWIPTVCSITSHTLLLNPEFSGVVFLNENYEFSNVFLLHSSVSREFLFSLWRKSSVRSIKQNFTKGGFLASDKVFWK